jgi:hypothetical protein
MMVKVGTETCSYAIINIPLCYTENLNAYLLKMGIPY